MLGAAVSGLAAARMGVRLGHRVTVYDRDPARLLELVRLPVGTLTGDWSSDVLAGIDLVVTSPGFPERARPIVDTLEAGIPLWSEVEFAWRHLDAPVVAVTGTNGKTTVTGTIEEMLRRSGMKTVAAGNIGTALADVVEAGWDQVVVEVSSFQLRFTESFAPEIAILLNIAPDHLDWHGSYERYAQAKARIFAHQRPEHLLIYDADDEGVAAVLTGEVTPRRTAVSGTRLPEGGAGVDGGLLRVGELTIDLDRLGLTDPAHLVDLAASAVAAFEAGADRTAVESAIRDFHPGPHRRVQIGRWKGVGWIDDSKATNPHAAVAAIKAYPSVVLIAGGRNKGLDLAPLAAQPNVRFVVALGEASEDLMAAAGPGRGRRAADMSEAVATAAGLARPGDVVLLAPGCASFDMFDSYVERGDRFAAAVRELQEAAP